MLCCVSCLKFVDSLIVVGGDEEHMPATVVHILEIGNGALAGSSRHVLGMAGAEP